MHLLIFNCTVWIVCGIIAFSLKNPEALALAFGMSLLSGIGWGFKYMLTNC